MSETNRQSYRFDEYELDLAKRRLLRSGEVVPLKPKAFDLLAVLVENNGKLLSKDDIFQLVWGDQFVEETNLSVSISAIRKALGETASEPKYITNVSGRGYYFTGDLNVDEAVILESRSYSRVVLEEELSDGDTSPRPLTGQVSRRWVLGSAVAVVLVGVISATTYFFGVRSGSAQSEVPEALSVNRLTSTGRTASAGISPDGKIFAFAQIEPGGGQSLWLSQIDGSGQIQLRPPSDRLLASVTFSPDATRIYYVQYEPNVITHGTLFRLPLIGGVPEKLHDRVPNRVTISPDGNQIAFLRPKDNSGRSTLVVASIDGSAERELASRPDAQGRFTALVDWSPNGQQLAVSTYTTDSEPGPIELFTVEVSSGELKQLTKQNWYSIRSLAWARDGKSIFAAVGDKSSDLERQIWSVSAENGSMKRLLADSNSYTSLDVSANGLILAIQGQSLSNVWIAPADDLAAAKQVTFDMLGKQSGWNSIDWLPDGGLIYSGRIGKSDTIWQMNVDGSEQRQVIAENGRNEYCSLPDDGSFIVFASNRTGQSEVWRSGRDGSDLRQLTFSGDNESPHISPDGKWVVYNSGKESERRLWRISSDGGTPAQLTSAPSDWARFSPDSTRLASAYEVEGKVKLAILPIDGGVPTNFFDIPPTANFRLGVRWTPDGQAVTYRDWLNGIWKQRLDGGPPTRIEGLPAEKLFGYAWSRDGTQFAFARGTAISDAVLLTSLK